MAKQTTNDNLLSGEIDDSSPLFQKLLIDMKDQDKKSQENESHNVAPQPGWCLKTWTLDDKKVFVNVCTSDLVLKPKDLSEEEVRKIIEDEDPTKFRIPMGIGELHKERDQKGEEVDTYDIVIHPEFFAKCKKISFFKEFFIMLVFDGLEAKYELQLNREYKILKNRKALGTLRMQNVRSRSKPVIMEMDPIMYEMEKEKIEESKSSEAIISEVSSVKKKSSKSEGKTYTTPSFTMLQEPETGYPEFLVFEIDLPLQKTSEQLLLDVSEDRLVLHGHHGNYKLDLDLPYDVDNDNIGAQFHRKHKKLSITMPVRSKKL